MSREDSLTLAKLATNLFGAILLALGLMLTYFSMKADADIVNPSMFTPIGLAIVIIGVLMFATRER